MWSENLRGAVSIVGVGTTEQGELPGKGANEIAAEALNLAFDDAGLEKSDIDGLITCKSRLDTGVDTSMGEFLGLNPKYSATLDYGTCNFSVHLAAMVLAAGLADTIALTYAVNYRSERMRYSTVQADIGAPYGYIHIAGPAALALRRHMALYGTTEEQFAQIALNQRENARLNPLAVFQEKLSLEQYLASPFLVDPLRRHDITMISDGGASIIMRRTEQSHDLAKSPVALLGMAETTALRQFANDDHLMRPWLKDVADRVYASAGLGPTEVDVLFIQDPTAVWVLQMLEWYGFCGIGEAGPFLLEGHTRLGGSLPLNTNGGQLSESYMWGWLHLCELVRQLRGEAGPRQVSDAEVAMYCSTMSFFKGAASVFGRVR